MASRRRDAGQELVEYALVLPLLVLLVLAIIDLSVIVFSYNTIANAAREGARYGIVNPDDTAGIVDRVRDRALALEQSRLEVDVAQVDPTIAVTVRYQVQLLTGALVSAFGGSSMVPLRTAATMRTEQ